MPFPRRTALASCAGFAVLLSACTASDSDGSPESPKSAGSASGATSATCPSGTTPDPQDLAAALTTAIQSQDEKAFLAVASSDSARQGMTRWWGNMTRLGFTTGGVEFELDDNSTDTTAKLVLGAHNALDPVDDSDDEAVPKVPGSSYLVSMTLGADCAAGISSWKSLSVAPWDTIPKLYVRKTEHTVVAGLPEQKKAVDRVARLGEQAALWDRAILATNGHGDYVEQKGFVAFVAPNKTAAANWFRAPDSPKPHGWTADPSNVAGTEFPMDGVAPLPSGKMKQKISALPVGGSRIIINPGALEQDDKTLEGVLVHEFAHSIFRVYDLWSWGGDSPIDASLAEGAAAYFEALYTSYPQVPKSNKAEVSSLSVLKPIVQSRSFGGRMPSDNQIYGAAEDSNYYYDLSATGFTYLAAAYGIKFAFQSLRDAYLQGGGPFGGVIDTIKGSTITFLDPDRVEAKWAEWVRGGFPLPPKDPIR